ncbi:MAG TPA: hybrid sensor histidine kinase/response regulator [Chloroflexota bacterium]|nr:hybrid sensor histidine kinase/response regulator [Chloroflexota bacterium]HUM67366.1 hybrid sensor histidine kinase/response regulator [Chloroflexota bacterium]
MSQLPLILIIDDDPIHCEGFEDLLAASGFATATANGGAQALAKVETLQPDVLLVDVMMPEMDGFTLCRCIRQNPVWQHLPIILVTALNDKEDLLRGLMAGADEFLNKPVDTNELLVRIMSMLRIKRQHDQLQAALQLRKDMANMVVHDIRNPLNAIMLHSSLLASAQLSEVKVIDSAQAILDLARQTEAYLNDLLLAAKMEHGALVPDLKPLDVQQTLADQVKYLDVKLQATNLALHIDIPKQPYPIFLDSHLFTRAVDNLMANAIKHSPHEGSITLSASYPREYDPQGAVFTLSVMDEGMGIPATEAGRIFGKFETLKSQGGNGRAIGLGLAFCKMVADLHQGAICVKNREPHGANFTISFWIDQHTGKTLCT